MTTYSETIQARYAASEHERDSFGRMIEVQRLRPWDATQVRKLADSDRQNVMSDIMIAACVRSITDDTGKKGLFPPPRSETDIAVVMNALDSEGFSAALIAYMRLFGIDQDAKGDPADAEIDTAKN